MHVLINVKSPNNISKWQMGSNSAFKGLMQLFGELDIISFVRINGLIWIGYVKRMDSKRKIRQAFNNEPQGSRLRG
jgi:hypothetical protein